MHNIYLSKTERHWDETLGGHTIKYTHKQTTAKNK